MNIAKKSINSALLMFLLLFVCISIAHSGTVGIVSGVVRNAVTGEALAGATVTIDGVDGVAITDEAGFYSFTNVPPGEHMLTVDMDGFVPQSIPNVSVLMDITTNINIALQPEIVAEENVVVTETTSPKPKDALPSMYVVDSRREEIVRSEPNTLYQISGIVKTQPGVIVDADGWPHIRGGRANQIGYMIDGIPVTEPVTNGFGTNSVTVGLDKMEIFTGGYPAEYGNAISGIFNQVIKSGERYQGGKIELLGGNNDYLGIYPEFGDNIGTKAAYYIGGYAWGSDFDGMSFNRANSADTVAKIDYSLSAKDKLTLLSGNGSATYKFPYMHTQTLDPSIDDATMLIPTTPKRDNSHQSYNLNALTFTHSFSQSSFLSIKPYVFTNRWKVDALSDFATGMGVWVKGRSSTNGLKLDYVSQISSKHLIKAGYIGMSSGNDFRTAVPEMFDYDYYANADTKQTGAYIQDHIRFNDIWQLDAGMRYDRMKYYLESSKDYTQSQLSPRLGLNYAVNPSTNIRLSYGRMIQFVQTQALDRNYINPFWGEVYLNPEKLRPERSTQYDIGMEHYFNKDYSLIVTPFYRKFKDLLQTTSINPSSPDEPPYVYENLGTGTSKGVEFLLNKRPSKNWSGWLSYTYMISKATASDTGLSTTTNKIYVDWDQRHTVTSVINYNKNDWSYSLMAEYGSGFPYTFDGEPRNSRRVGSHFVVNANIAKRINHGILANGTIHLGISNLFNTGTALTKDQDGKPLTKVPSRFVNLSYKRDF